MVLFFWRRWCCSIFLLFIFLVYHLLTAVLVVERRALGVPVFLPVCFASGLDKASLLPAGPSRASYCEFGRWQALAKGTAWAG